jgi:hypothetical protein
MMSYFTNKDSWSGGFYELALELGNYSDTYSDERITSALKVLWSYPLLTGVYLQRDREPSQQQCISIHNCTTHPTQNHLQGLAALSDKIQVACGTFTVREEEDGSDWLVFYIPLGTLVDVYPIIGGYPFGSTDEESCKSWQVSINDWLVELGKYIFKLVKFRLGIVGFEVSGETYAQDLSEKGIPEQRYEGYLLPAIDSLRWYPPNSW